eukprot:scaffold136433_cov69-Phaeocystis_antarctica.AAC.6
MPPLPAPPPPQRAFPPPEAARLPAPASTLLRPLVPSQRAPAPPRPPPPRGLQSCAPPTAASPRASPPPPSRASRPCGGAEVRRVQRPRAERCKHLRQLRLRRLAPRRQRNLLGCLMRGGLRASCRLQPQRLGLLRMCVRLARRARVGDRVLLCAHARLAEGALRLELRDNLAMRAQLTLLLSALLRHRTSRAAQPLQLGLERRLASGPRATRCLAAPLLLEQRRTQPRSLGHRRALLGGSPRLDLYLRGTRPPLLLLGLTALAQHLKSALAARRRLLQLRTQPLVRVRRVEQQLPQPQQVHMKRPQRVSRLLPPLALGAV